MIIKPFQLMMGEVRARHVHPSVNAWDHRHRASGGVVEQKLEAQPGQLTHVSKPCAQTCAQRTAVGRCQTAELIPIVHHVGLEEFPSTCKFPVEPTKELFKF